MESYHRIILDYDLQKIEKEYAYYWTNGEGRKGNIEIYLSFTPRDKHTGSPCSRPGATAAARHFLQPAAIYPKTCIHT